MTNQQKAYLCAVPAVLLWSTVASAFKVTLRELDVLQMLCIASVVSASVLFVIALVQRKAALVFRQTRRDLLRSAGMGFLNPFLYYVVLFKAYDLLPAQQALPLNYTWPIVLTLLSAPLLKQRIKPRGFAALCISFCGVTVIASKGNLSAFALSDPAGYLLALASAVVWALSWIATLRDRRDPIIRLLTNFVFGSCFATAALLLFSTIPPLSVTAAAGAAYIGLFEMGVTFVLWLHALRLSEQNARVSNLAYLAPFLSLLFIHVIVGEHIHPSSVIGLLLIVAGILAQGTCEGTRAARP